MTSPSLDSFSDQVFAQGVKCLGVVVWQHLRDLRISELDLSALATAHGLREAPRLGHPSDAFRKATSPCQRRDGSFRYLMRPVVDDAAHIVRQIVVEEVNAPKEELQHAAVAELRFDKAYKNMTYGMLGKLGAVTLTPSQVQVCQAFMADAVANYEAFRKNLTGDDLTRFVMKQLAAMSFVSVHPNGGVYFVPATRREELKKLQGFVHALSGYAIHKPGFSGGNTFTALPVPALPEHAASIEQAFRASIDRDLEGLIAEVAVMLAAPGKPGQAVVRGRVEQIAAARAKAEEYAGLLGIKIEETTAKLTMLAAQADELRQRSTGAGNDPALGSVKNHPAVKAKACQVAEDGQVLSVSCRRGALFQLESNTRGYRLAFSREVSRRALRAELCQRPECTFSNGTYKVATKDPAVVLLYTGPIMAFEQAKLG